MVLVFGFLILLNANTGSWKSVYEHRISIGVAPFHGQKFYNNTLFRLFSWSWFLLALRGAKRKEENDWVHPSSVPTAYWTLQELQKKATVLLIFVTPLYTVTFFWSCFMLRHLCILIIIINLFEVLIVNNLLLSSTLKTVVCTKFSS